MTGLGSLARHSGRVSAVAAAAPAPTWSDHNPEGRQRPELLRPRRGTVPDQRRLAATCLHTLTTDAGGNTGHRVLLPVASLEAQYAVVESVAPLDTDWHPPGRHRLKQRVTPGVTITGQDIEQINPAQLGAEKVDAQTNQPLAGAVFDFKYDTQNSGVYDEDLGTCTTPASGICQPPTKNDGNAWLPGKYEITEQSSPQHFALPANPVRTVNLFPGAEAVVSVIVGDEHLGSSRSSKVGTTWPTGRSLAPRSP